MPRKSRIQIESVKPFTDFTGKKGLSIMGTIGKGSALFVSKFPFEDLKIRKK